MVIDKYLGSHSLMECNAKCFSDIIGDYYVATLKNSKCSRSVGPFPAGVVLHSYLGSAEMVPEFSKLGAYFSFSGFLMSLKANKAKKMLKMVIFIISILWLMLNVIFLYYKCQNSDILIFYSI